jgi:hypothetical protein
VQSKRTNWYVSCFSCVRYAFIHSCIHSVIHAVSHSFIHSFIHSFSQSYIYKHSRTRNPIILVAYCCVRRASGNVHESFFERLRSDFQRGDIRSSEFRGARSDSHSLALGRIKQHGFRTHTHTHYIYTNLQRSRNRVYAQSIYRDVLYACPTLAFIFRVSLSGPITSVVRIVNKQGRKKESKKEDKGLLSKP